MVKRLTEKVAEGAKVIAFNLLVVGLQLGICAYAEYDDYRRKSRIIREATPEQAKFLKRLRRSRTEREREINTIHCRRAGVTKENIQKLLEPHPLEQIFSLHDAW